MLGHRLHDRMTRGHRKTGSGRRKSGSGRQTTGHRSNIAHGSTFITIASGALGISGIGITALGLSHRMTPRAGS